MNGDKGSDQSDPVPTDETYPLWSLFPMLVAERAAERKRLAGGKETKGPQEGLVRSYLGDSESTTTTSQHTRQTDASGSSKRTVEESVTETADILQKIPLSYAEALARSPPPVHAEGTPLSYADALSRSRAPIQATLDTGILNERSYKHDSLQGRGTRPGKRAPRRECITSRRRNPRLQDPAMKGMSSWVR